MQKRSLIGWGVLVISLITIALVAGKPAQNNIETDQADPSCCKTQIQECVQKSNTTPATEQYMETLSRQLL